MADKFPSPLRATSEGIVSIGQTVNFENLKEAYSKGIFPWPVDDKAPVLWFSLNPRGVLIPDRLHISKSMKRVINSNSYDVIFNRDFEKIILACATIRRKGETSTWIDGRIYNAYIDLYRRGHAYCVAVYDRGELVGGLYGACFGQMISAESMFHLKPNTSKLALVSLAQRLKLKNIPLLDTQMLTPVVQALGGEEIPKLDFLSQISTLDLQVPRDQIFGDTQ